MRGTKILYVDDEADWRTTVATALEAAGFDICAVKDASEALAKAEDGDLRLVILDLNLAGENGMMLLKFLRHNNPEVPVLLYTGLEHDEAAVQSMLQQGADQYLRKGSMQELIVAIGAYFR
jgi:DNA-binding response OmpR family regulator